MCHAASLGFCYDFICLQTRCIFTRCGNVFSLGCICVKVGIYVRQEPVFMRMKIASFCLLSYRDVV